MKPRLLLTTRKRDWLDPGLPETLGERFTVIVKSVRKHARSRSARSIVVSKKGLIVEEARYLLRLCADLALYKGDWTFVCSGGHYANLLFARLYGLVGARRPVLLLNFYLHDLGKKRWIQLALRALLTKDVYVVAQAPTDSDYFQAFLPAKNVRYQPYCQGPLDLGSYDGTRREFVFAGGWTNRDYDALFRCAARLPHIEFVVAASAQSSLAETRPPNVNVRLDCEPREFHRLLAESRLVVLPLRNDVGSSGQMVLLAAMQLGKAVIVSNIGAVRDYVDEGMTGLFYHPGDDEELAGLLEDIYASPSRLDGMGQAARERYMERFTPECYRRAVTDLVYGTICTGADSRSQTGTGPPDASNRASASAT
jgi:glycosyltransferase involved in cell wall biosynthesis